MTAATLPSQVNCMVLQSTTRKLDTVSRLAPAHYLTDMPNDGTEKYMFMFKPQVPRLRQRSENHPLASY